jgi:hypothetical protein
MIVSKDEAPNMSRNERRLAARGKEKLANIHKRHYAMIYWAFRGKWKTALAWLVKNGLVNTYLGEDDKQYWGIKDSPVPADAKPVPARHRERFLTDPEVWLWIWNNLEMDKYIKYIERKEAKHA